MPGSLVASETSITSGTVLLVKLLLEELACGMYTYIHNYNYITNKLQITITFDKKKILHKLLHSLLCLNRLREAARQAATSTYRIANHYTHPLLVVSLLSHPAWERRCPLETEGLV